VRMSVLHLQHQAASCVDMIFQRLNSSDKARGKASPILDTIVGSGADPG